MIALGAGASFSALESRFAPPLTRAAAAEEQLWQAIPAMASLVADWSWLQANAAWEKRDEQSLRLWLRQTVAVEPEQFYFRANAARMLAYDVPEWRIVSEPAVPGSVAAAWKRAAADEAVALILRGPAESPATWIEAGNIAWFAGGDLARAAEYFGRAAHLPHAPWHAGRIHARLLVETGRTREAAEFLREWVETLPADDPAAQRVLMQHRLAELERAIAQEGF